MMNHRLKLITTKIIYAKITCALDYKPCYLPKIFVIEAPQNLSRYPVIFFSAAIFPLQAVKPVYLS